MEQTAAALTWNTTLQISFLVLVALAALVILIRTGAAAFAPQPSGTPLEMMLASAMKALKVEDPPADEPEKKEPTDG